MAEGLRRIARAWQELTPAQRRPALLSIALILSMFLPWYSKNSSAVTKQGLQTTHDATGAIWVFTFVEAAVLLVTGGVLWLLYARANRRAFHLPGGDGFVVALAGGWVSLLIFYRLLDQPSGEHTKFVVFDYGLAWGIFVALVLALGLAYSGWRLRAAHLVEPPLPGEVAPTEPQEPRPPRARAEVVPFDAEDEAPTVAVPRRPPPPPEVDGGEQLSFDE